MFDMASLDMDKARHKKVRAGGEPARAGLPIATTYCLLRSAYCYCTAAPLTAPANFNYLLLSAYCNFLTATTHLLRTAYCSCTLRTATSTATTHCVLQLQRLHLLLQSFSAYHDCNFYRNHSLRIATATSTATHCSLLLQQLTTYSDNSLQRVACRNRLKRFRSVSA